MSAAHKVQIAVLAGGFNEERNLSLQGGQQVYDALCQRYANVKLIDWASPAVDLPSHLSDADVCFNCLHGTLGEDGHIAGLLEVLRIPYTFSGVFGSACGSDKARSKDLLTGKKDVKLVPGVQAPTWELREAIKQKGSKACPVTFPVMVKDPLQGSSKGVWLCKNVDEYAHAILQVTGAETVVEKFVKGVDVVVCMLEGKSAEEGVEAWPVMEFETELEWQDNASKNALWGWEGGAADTKKPVVLKNCPPKHLAPEIERKTVEMAKAIYRHLRAKTALNAEFRISEEGEIYFIEVSVVPGLTSTSVHATCAAAAGVSYEDLVDRMLATARVELDMPKDQLSSKL
eukprot:gnl/MRDRNA2_/MRDRNA2_74382_c0_seq1.p1 gnl/MRDRNA2_/MRDRNA2_74382_c0~~gnl/MRDRNA2_/MRDRNA2_74382_c0_seq1.p1  ORF type:complete len:344 (-),score=85.11 gnl/MRDRNA2_/MRDRNA2_74382_c0_seq1:408-1439(-)